MNLLVRAACEVVTFELVLSSIFLDVYDRWSSLSVSRNTSRPHGDGDGDGERCVTPARTAAKETTSNIILLKSRKSNL